MRVLVDNFTGAAEGRFSRCGRPERGLGNFCHQLNLRFALNVIIICLHVCPRRISFRWHSRAWGDYQRVVVLLAPFGLQEGVARGALSLEAS